MRGMCAQEAWDDNDGTLLGAVGYSRVLESPAVAYSELQAQYFAAQQASSRGSSPDAASVRLPCFDLCALRFLLAVRST
jgi:hypothetical protein